ncbi:MAG: hypothetical protein V1738_04020 [Patescibacteria group bacterium]
MKILVDNLFMAQAVGLLHMALSHSDNHEPNSALSALAWFDVFGFPLTAIEVARYSPLFGQPITVSEVIDSFSSSPHVIQVGGYYSLTASGTLTQQRQQRFRRTGPKLMRAKRVARLFGLLPSVRLVALCNSLAVANAGEDSDIDLFVVCRSGTLWLTRLTLAIPLIALGLRPTPANQKDKICLSFLVSENALDMSRYQCGDDDPYMRFWIETVVPLHDAGGVFDHFRRLNGWRYRSSKTTTIEVEKAGFRTSGRIDRIAKRLQLARFPNRIRQMANLDSRVLISDDILKFHVNDRRELYRDRFRERLETISL